MAAPSITFFTLGQRSCFPIINLKNPLGPR